VHILRENKTMEEETQRKNTRFIITMLVLALIILGGYVLMFTSFQNGIEEGKELGREETSTLNSLYVLGCLDARQVGEQVVLIWTCAVEEGNG